MEVDINVMWAIVREWNRLATRRYSQVADSVREADPQEFLAVT